MTNDDQKRLVAQGYDRIADAYQDRFGESSIRARKLAELVGHLPSAASILDLGCGSGLPVARDLAALGFDVIGVDASSEQIESARRNVPGANFVNADMGSVDFAPQTFDAVSAFYSITHLPKSEHAGLIQRIAYWLKPGGRFLVCFGGDEGDWQGEWMGTGMFFSHHAPETVKRLIQEAGLCLQKVELLKQDNENIEFLWIMSQKLDFCSGNPDIRDIKSP